MKRRLTYIAPLPLGKILGILYAMFGLIFLPFFAIAAIAGLFAESGDGSAGAAGAMAGGMIAMALIFPIMYAVMGFVGGVICAALYNLISRWVGGLEFEVEDVPRSASETPVQSTSI